MTGNVEGLLETRFRLGCIRDGMPPLVQFGIGVIVMGTGNTHRSQWRGTWITELRIRGVFMPALRAMHIVLPQLKGNSGAGFYKKALCTRRIQHSSERGNSTFDAESLKPALAVSNQPRTLKRFRSSW